MQCVRVHTAVVLTRSNFRKLSDGSFVCPKHSGSAARTRSGGVSSLPVPAPPSAASGTAMSADQAATGTASGNAPASPVPPGVNPSPASSAASTASHGASVPVFIPEIVLPDGLTPSPQPPAQPLAEVRPSVCVPVPDMCEVCVRPIYGARETMERADRRIPCHRRCFRCSACMVMLTPATAHLIDAADGRKVCTWTF